MSEARNLLKQALEELSDKAIADEDVKAKGLCVDIMAYLARPEPDPVAEVVYAEPYNSNGLRVYKKWFDNYPIGTKFYAEPPDQKPLTPQEWW